MSKALYRKYRSKSLDEVVGQSHVTEILARSLKQGKIAHAYLFTGPRGVGKTSIARILAHEINNLPYTEDSPHLDIIEIDAASNNGVEDVRELREKVQITPVSASKKVYIIDEVHMLSKAAFNALLKTLEEPPEHVVFMLATTDSDKLPATIISRTQRFQLRTIGKDDLINHLRSIAEREKIKIDDRALEIIASRGDGSFRDSISLLDQLSSIADKKTGITGELVERMLGMAPVELVDQLLTAYEAKDLSAIVKLIDQSEQQGIQTTVLTGQLIQEIRQHVAQKPQLIDLLDQLLEVGKSSHPNIKLLSILAAHATTKAKTAALSAPTPEISASVEELKKKVKKPAPALAGSNQPAGLASAESYMKEGEQSTKTPEEINLDWEKLVEHTRQNFVAVYSVLSKCTHELDGEKLILYTGNNFYKKKLDDTKHLINLRSALAEVGAEDAVIETIGTPPPPKDGVAASVAAIMGGGEEVSVEAPA